jgi:ATP-dependent Clp protease ATP-binding subunit ClpA
MPFSELYTRIYKAYGPALILRQFFTREERHKIEKILLFASVIVFFIGLFFYAVEMHQYITPLSALGFPHISERLFGLFFILFSLTFLMTLGEALYRFYYFRGLSHILSEDAEERQNGITWPIATIVYETSADDFTEGFISSSFGQEVLYRAGVSSEALVDFYEKRTKKIDTGMVIVDKMGAITLVSYTKTLLKYDAEFALYMAKNGVSEEALLSSAEWVMDIEMKQQLKERWWSRDALSRIEGIGKNWSYGQTFLLRIYGHDLRNDVVWGQGLIRAKEEEDEVNSLESILARKRQANVLFVGDDLLMMRERVAQLYHSIVQGSVLSPLEAHRIFFLDIEGMIMKNPQKGDFEVAFTQTLQEAVSSGNIILYSEGIHHSIESAREIGVDIIEIFRPFAESQRLQIIWTTEKRGFDKILSNDKRVENLFDTLFLHTIDGKGVFRSLRERAYKREKTTGILFSAPALLCVRDSAEMYFPMGSMPDKAFDLLEELFSYASTHSLSYIQKKDVEFFIREKTDMPIGIPNEDEKKKLLSLEKTLETFVLGQKNACVQTASTLRRSYSGIEKETKKPKGSFLFLGPTGVGKTEMAKTLSSVFFQKTNITRIDMSEYQKNDALSSLLGDSLEEEKVGILESLVTEKRYGVLLLDEFEKAHKTVHDLFLQILDEGWYTSARGRKMYLTQFFIIATSNAGADMIWEWQKEKKDISQKKNEIIDSLVQKNIFRPELLNRFDDVIIFEPLEENTIKQIIDMNLKRTAENIYKKHYITLVYEEGVEDAFFEVGYNNAFGARPLLRAIEEKVVGKVADALLRNDISTGDTFTLTKEMIKGRHEKE